MDDYVRLCRSIGRASRRLSRLAARQGASTLVARLEAVVTEARALQSAHIAGSEARAEPPASELDFAIDHLMVARVLMPETQRSVREAIEMALFLLARNVEVRDSP